MNFNKKHAICNCDSTVSSTLPVAGLAVEVGAGGQ